MMIQHKFVEFIPDKLEEGILYISVTYATVLHKCFCGCGNEVVTPLSPLDWELTFDGKTISLYPSIGNWGLPCRSHYWIRRSKIQWAASWSDEMISMNRKRDVDARNAYHSPKNKWKLWNIFGKKKD